MGEPCPKFETEKKNVTPVERGCSLAQVALQPKMTVGINPARSVLFGRQRSHTITVDRGNLFDRFGQNARGCPLMQDVHGVFARDASRTSTIALLRLESV
jgi:hypothetical protein